MIFGREIQDPLLMGCNRRRLRYRQGADLSFTDGQECSINIASAPNLEGLHLYAEGLCRCVRLLEHHLGTGNGGIKKQGNARNAWNSFPEELYSFPIKLRSTDGYSSHISARACEAGDKTTS